MALRTTGARGEKWGTRVSCLSHFGHNSLINLQKSVLRTVEPLQLRPPRTLRNASYGSLVPMRTVSCHGCAELISLLLVLLSG